MTRTYYYLWYRLDHRDGYLLWFSNDVDGLITTPDGMVPSFGALPGLQAYASLAQLDLQEDAFLLYDLDVVAAWLRQPLETELDAEELLNAWNLFTDLAASVNSSFEENRALTQPVYEKLFWANNLPSVTPAGKQYIPVWSDDELRVMQEVLSHGLDLFRTHVKRQ
ncbi:MAG: hypothetical protein JOZ51_24575 [Chloroflexi bacterium]|nr:hypothetical protein [Chloroflexota bacterium]